MGWVPPSRRHRTLAALPFKPLKRGSNPALLGHADLRRVDEQPFAGDFQDGHPLSPDQKPADFVFPSIGLVSRFLLRGDVLSLEIRVGPPLDTPAVELGRLGEELIPVTDQGIDIDGADLDRPEAPASGFVPQIGGLIGGSDEKALPRLNDLLPSIARPVPLDAAGYECLEGGRFRLV